MDFYNLKMKNHPPTPVLCSVMSQDRAPKKMSKPA